MNRRPLFALLVAAGLTAIGAVAYAERGDATNDALPTPEANGHISLIQAVQTAELHAAGKARQAEYEHSRQGWVYDVEVINGSKVFDVRVNARSGVVISSQEDKPDGPGENDDKDKED